MAFGASQLRHPYGREISKGERMIAAATLAAGIIQARGVKTPAEINSAFWDAFNIVHPDPGSHSWVQWARRYGVPIPGGTVLLLRAGWSSPPFSA